MLVASSDELHDLRPHHRSTNDGERAIDVDERCDSQLGVNVAGRAKAGCNGDDRAAVHWRQGRFAFLARDARGVQIGRSEQPSPYGPNRGQKRSAIPTKFQIHAQRPFNSLPNYRPAGGVGGLTTIALPTISINESPGIHSTAMHARDGALPEEK